MGLCFPMRRMAIRDARRPNDGGVRAGEEAGGRGRIVERAWCGAEAEMWCQVRE
jgi:hypothetical protein